MYFPLHVNWSILFGFFSEEPDVRTRKIVKVVTQTMVNGKIVDESSEVEQIEERKKWDRQKEKQCNVVIYIDLNIYIVRTWGGWIQVYMFFFSKCMYEKSHLMCPMCTTRILFDQ